MTKRISDAAGKRFGKVIIIEDRLANQKALLRCDCGAEKTVRRYDLFSGKIKSCGSTKCAGKWVDITDKRFDQLVAAKYIGLSGNKQTIVWECRCDCGNIIRTGYTALITGHKKSCGCIKGERVSRAMSLPIKTTVENQIYNDYKKNANKRGLTFDISKEEFISFMYGDCFYCGNGPSNFINKKRVTGNEVHFYNGVDRVNNKLGYSAENCVTCCKLCNHAKNNMTKDEFIELATKIASFVHQRNSTSRVFCQDSKSLLEIEF